MNPYLHFIRTPGFQISLPVALFICLMWGYAPAALEQASVTESVNTVSYQTSAHAAQKAAPSGTVIHPENIVRTGMNSRAELQFSDNTVTRMGANSVFSYDTKSQRMDLMRGTALFSKPKNDESFEISTPAATCSISGTTGFLQVLPAPKGRFSFLFGLLEGHTSVTLGGKSYPVTSGELIISTGAGIVHFANFNITAFLAKAGLAQKFKSKLPNDAAIKKAEAHFASLVSRGFIEPTNFEFGTNGNQLALIESFGVGPEQNVRELAAQVQNFEQRLQTLPTSGLGSGSGFVNVGANGIIRGQLVWNVDVDLDLHLTLPGGAGTVYYANPSVTFNNGAATANLDADNQGGVVNVGPNERVENIVISGTPSSGAYNFFPVYFAGSQPASYTLTTTGNNGATTQVTTGTLSSPGQQGASNVITR